MVLVVAVVVICVCAATGVSTVLTLIDSLGLLKCTTTFLFKIIQHASWLRRLPLQLQSSIKYHHANEAQLLKRARGCIPKKTHLYSNNATCIVAAAVAAAAAAVTQQQHQAAGK
jgi:hypothetical protein